MGSEHRRRDVTAMMESPEEITVESMEQMLKEAMKDVSISVLAPLEVHELEELHAGSCLRRVTLQYTRSGQQMPHTLYLIVKVLPNIPSLAEVFQNGTMFQREIHMFDQILPRMSALLSRALPDHHTNFAARVYHTRTHPSYLIAMEDLAPRGFKAPHRKSGLDLQHCRLAITTLARFHAASVMIHLEDQSLFQVFDSPCFYEEPMNLAMRDIARQFFHVVSRAVDCWPEFGPSWGDRLRKRYETLFDDLNVVYARDDGAFNVLNHGDFGLHNIMFRYSECGEPEAIMLVDFQCCNYNSPALDLHQLLFSSATDQVLADHIDMLLREYHQQLAATLKMLGTPEEHVISLVQLMHEFESKMLCAVLHTFCFLPFFNFDPKSGLTWEDIFKLDSQDSHKIETIFSESCVKSLKRMITIFSQKMLL